MASQTARCAFFLDSERDRLQKLQKIFEAIREPMSDFRLIRETGHSFNVLAALALVMVVQASCWILVPVLTNDAPPLDVVENTVWGAERIIASYKNPALSSLLLEAGRWLTGAVGWPAYVLSQIAVGCTFICVFLLGRAELGNERALVGTVLLTSCYYFGWHTPEFNQDIVEMPFWAGIALALWRAVETRRLGWWAALGLFAAGALYGKLSASMILLAAASWIVVDARARRTLATPGPWLALAIFAIVITPLGLWLWHGGLETIASYAVERGRTKFTALHFIGLQLLIIAPMLLVLWTCGLLRTSRDSSRGERHDADRRFVRYLLWMTILPILLAALAVTLARTGTKIMWGVPMLNLSGLLVVALAGGAQAAYTTAALKRAVAASIVLILATSTGVALTTRFGNQFRPVPDRQNWLQAEISQRFRTIFANETGRPLRIVAGDHLNWVAGLIALGDLDTIQVFTAADTKFSPWITPDLIARDGALVVWPKSGETPPQELATIVGNRQVRDETFPLRHPGIVRDVTISYAVVPPAAAPAIDRAK